jgi:uncharacterized DUF497 family protein
MQFDWDPEKARKNLAKHGISFNEATRGFDAPLFLTFADLDHSFQERRFIIMGELGPAKEINSPRNDSAIALGGLREQSLTHPALGAPLPGRGIGPKIPSWEGCGVGHRPL